MERIVDSEVMRRKSPPLNEDIVFRIERGDLLDILDHPNPSRYKGQRIFVVRRDAYVSSLLHKYASGRLKEV
jgi:hypothetical protein